MDSKSSNASRPPMEVDWTTVVAEWKAAKQVPEQHPAMAQVETELKRIRNTGAIQV